MALFEQHLIKKLNPIETTDGRVVYEFTVDETLVNAFDTLHGGVTATIVDVLTTHALLTVSDHPGVSVELSVSFLAAAPINTTVVVYCDVIRKGKSLAFLECVLKDKKDPTKTFARGRHIKFLNPPLAKL